MRTLRARLESERGSALVTALLVMGIMMSIAIPLMSMVDTQQRMTSAERLHEGSFSLTDAVLNAQVFVHQRRIREMPLERLKAGYADLVDRLMS